MTKNKNENARRLPAAILLAVACHMANAEAPQKTILQCDGEQWGQGIDAPKDAVIPSRDPHVVGTYTIHGDTLIESGDGVVADGRYALCSATSTTYVFSSDCKAQRNRYITDWLGATDIYSDTSSFAKKYKDSPWSLDIITIDRINLRVDEENISNYARTDFDKQSRKATVRPFLVSIRYAGSCSFVKPRF
ncbi:hypothetical protein A8H39_20620 [Paraburkholderia fungorum]|jgi:hypothetical protein|uniref:hypothetical protein n=1 Tax=Paraburkholderia fungorum TaxID=134537 RepID=UPI000483E6B0|nr:hypothetical protein [Paraburkholderia fungorum]MBB5546350.1 hypothetical protein [Paraburkholderia fungorum]PNE58005.1 hypothetical protein A8H39_20620 [Paraburkholderia fungorum]